MTTAASRPWGRRRRYIVPVAGARYAPYTAGVAILPRRCSRMDCDNPVVFAAGYSQHSTAGDAVVATELYYCQPHARHYADAHGLALPAAVA